MLRITNISISDRAAEVLDRLWVTFRPQETGDVFALAYMSSFTEADGATVDGFRPGYTAYSLAPDGLASDKPVWRAMAEMKMDYRSKLQSIRSLLLAEWDPIGVRDEVAAQDEYDHYLPAILDLLERRASATEVASYLGDVAHAGNGAG